MDAITATAVRIADRASREIIESEFSHDSPCSFCAPWPLMDDPVIEEAVQYLIDRKLAARVDLDEGVVVIFPPEVA